MKRVTGLQTVALNKVFKRHARMCTYWVFSGDRHCSCGRDAALLELSALEAAARDHGPHEQTFDEQRLPNGETL